VGCDVLRGVGALKVLASAFSSNCSAIDPPLRYRTSAKSIAACRMHLQKKLHGGLRRFRSSAKSFAPCKLQSQQNLLKNLHGGLRGVSGVGF